MRINPSLNIEYYPALYMNTDTFLDLISNIYHLSITAAVATTIVASIAVAVTINTRITILKLLEFSY